jgi:hypothetical protein
MVPFLWSHGLTELASVSVANRYTFDTLALSNSWPMLRYFIAQSSILLSRAEPMKRCPP